MTTIRSTATATVGTRGRLGHARGLMDSLDAFSSAHSAGLERSAEAGGALGGISGFDSSWDLDAELQKLDAREVELFSGIGLGSDLPPAAARSSPSPSPSPTPTPTPTQVAAGAQAAQVDDAALSDAERVRALAKKVAGEGCYFLVFVGLFSFLWDQSRNTGL
eukprot:SAG31_NODE_2123_length_6401_cov_4.982069_8_plen_163_part_00